MQGTIKKFVGEHYILDLINVIADTSFKGEEGKNPKTFL